MDPKRKARLVQALAGSASAQQAIGHAFLIGDGVGRNKRRALSFLKMAARQGDPHHQMDYGVFLTAQNGIVDFRNGFSWILRAAKNGLREAQYFVASEYANGDRVRKKLKKRHIGMVLLQGKEVPRLNTILLLCYWLVRGARMLKGVSV